MDFEIKIVIYHEFEEKNYQLLLMLGHMHSGTLQRDRNYIYRYDPVFILTPPDTIPGT